MKILFTGGGSGGHFYPIIAVAEEINKIIERDHLLNAQLYFVAPEPYNRALLQENGILFKKVSAGKMRRYFSLLNFLDIFKTSAGIVRAIVLLYSIFPDVIFSKGGTRVFRYFSRRDCSAFPSLSMNQTRFPEKQTCGRGSLRKGSRSRMLTREVFSLKIKWRRPAIPSDKECS